MRTNFTIPSTGQCASSRAYLQAAERSLADARGDIERLGCAHIDAAVAAATAACGGAHVAPHAAMGLGTPTTGDLQPAAVLSEYGATPASLAAGGELALQDRAMREIDENAPAGYGRRAGGTAGKEGGVDVTGTQVRVLGCTVAELRRAIAGLQQRLQESAALERRVRELLAEARGRERTGAQRLATEAARVHALEMMRMNGARASLPLQLWLLLRLPHVDPDLAWCVAWVFAAVSGQWRFEVVSGQCIRRRTWLHPSCHSSRADASPPLMR